MDTEGFGIVARTRKTNCKSYLRDGHIGLFEQLYAVSALPGIIWDCTNSTPTISPRLGRLPVKLTVRSSNSHNAVLTPWNTAIPEKPSNGGSASSSIITVFSKVISSRNRDSKPIPVSINMSMSVSTETSKPLYNRHLTTKSQRTSPLLSRFLLSHTTERDATHMALMIIIRQISKKITEYLHICKNCSNFAASNMYEP